MVKLFNNAIEDIQERKRSRPKKSRGPPPQERVSKVTSSGTPVGLLSKSDYNQEYPTAQQAQKIYQQGKRQPNSSPYQSNHPIHHLHMEEKDDENEEEEEEYVNLPTPPSPPSSSRTKMKKKKNRPKKQSKGGGSNSTFNDKAITNLEELLSNLEDRLEQVTSSLERAIGSMMDRMEMLLAPLSQTNMISLTPPMHMPMHMQMAQPMNNHHSPHPMTPPVWNPIQHMVPPPPYHHPQVPDEGMEE
ncbi:MAG TPA: hypothetical protein EYO58_07945 [Flavobacteriales bacterium]|nr:hypothetical protein [Flavobacteriales bacterium]